MKVILLKDVKGVGRMYEERSVADGYAMNLLLPKKLAIPASGAAAAQINNLKLNDAKHREAEHRRLETEVHKLGDTKIKFIAKANEKNHLFASLTAEKIAEILKKQNIEVPVENIILEKPIKELGTHSIPVRVGDKTAHFNLVIESK